MAIIRAPNRVFLFTGHMIDSPDREQPRFPAAMEDVAQNAIASALERLAARKGEVAISSGACGGDLLFAEAALSRGLSLEMFLPFEEAGFIAQSVACGGNGWIRRFRDAKDRATVHVLSEAPRAMRLHSNPFAAVNLWMLDTASRLGAIQLICLWDGESGDGPGGTKHLVDAVRRLHGAITWLDTKLLWQQKKI